MGSPDERLEGRLVDARILRLASGLGPTAVSWRAYRRKQTGDQPKQTADLRYATLGLGAITRGVLVECVLFEGPTLTLTQGHVVAPVGLACEFRVRLLSFLG